MTWLFIFIGIMVFIAIKIDDYKVGQKIKNMDKYNLNHGQMCIDRMHGMSARQVERKMAAGGYYKKKYDSNGNRITNSGNINK